MKRRKTISQKIQVKVYFWLIVVWVCLVPPTLLWWGENLKWISFMSIYAIIVAHLASWQSARVAKKQDEGK